MHHSSMKSIIYALEVNLAALICNPYQIRKMTYTLLMHHSPCKKQFSELPPNDIFVMIIRASGIFLLIRIAMED